MSQKQGNEEVQTLKSVNEKLLNEIKDYKNQIQSAREEILACTTEISKERDARYILFAENVNLHMKMRQITEADNYENNYYCHRIGDPVILKIALEKCRDQLSLTQKRLKTMIDDYSDTVPKNIFESLETKYHEAIKAFDIMNIGKGLLEEQNTKLQAQQLRLNEELAELKDRCSELERAGTPRPHWKVCGDFIGGGSERWKQLSKGLSSRETLMVILKELGPAAKTENLEYFEGLGCDPIIPPYLRYEGKIRNRRLTRRELSVIINDIWTGKNDGNVAAAMSMQDYVTKYFEDRYQQPSVRAEWAYNVCSAAEQMLDDQQIKLFWGILNGHLSEDIYWGLRKEWASLRDNVKKYARDDETITLEELERVTRGTFPLKSDVEVRNIAEVARKQLKLRSNNNVTIDKLFKEDDEGFDRTELARELFRQRQNAQDKYIREIINELGGKKALNKMIKVDDLRRAFAVIDPAIDHVRMEKNIRWAFSDKTSDMQMIYPLPLKVITAKMACGNTERAGPRDRRKARVRKTTYR